MRNLFRASRRIRALALLSVYVLFQAGCGSNSSKPPSLGALSGNWQFNLVKNYPFAQEQLFVSGFLQQSNENVTGSVQGPVTTSVGGSAVNCGGTGPLVGTINGQNVSFTLSPGGTTFNFSGTIASDSQSMSGTYEALGGACYSYPTSGTWSASLVPPLNGSFTGTFNSNYMQALNGTNTPVPISVSGSFTESPNSNSSTATLTGTITAAGYPCFSTASLTGTISGQNIYLALYGYNGLQIGTLGQVQPAGVPPTPATLTVTSTGLVVSGTNQSGFFLDLQSPCPAVVNSFGQSQTTDSGDFTLNMQ